MTKSKKTVKKAVAKVIAKKVEKKILSAGPVKIKGSGDYVPTKFSRVRGSGGYFGDIGGALGGLFGEKGAKWGSALGGLGDAGLGLAHIISGKGDYKDRALAANKFFQEHPDSVGSKLNSSTITNPQSMNMGALNVNFSGAGGNPRVTHREFIGTVLGSVAFNTKVYRIQPGLRGANVLFPWGSSVANCFEQYQLNGMILEYKTRSTNFSSSVQLGAVMMSTVYDAEAPPLAGQIAVDNHEFTTSDVPSNTFIHPIECASKESPLTVRYVQAGNAPALNDDERFNDVGIFQVSTIGMPAAADGQVVGELWATYDITFLKPALPDIHAGTTAVLNAINLPSGQMFQPASGTVEWDQASSYPVSIISDSQLQLPLSYAGTYQLTVLTSAGAAANFSTLPYLSAYGSDITMINSFVGWPASVADTYTSAGAHAGLNQTSTESVQYGDFTNMQSKKGSCVTYTFSTIADTLTNNTLTFVQPVFDSVTGYSLTILFNAMDNDVPSGRYESTPPHGLTQTTRRDARRKLLEGARHVAAFQGELESERRINKELAARLQRLENLLSTPGLSTLHVDTEYDSVTPQAQSAGPSLSDSMVGSAIRKALLGISASAQPA